MSRTVHNVIPGDVLQQKVKYFIMKVIKGSDNHCVSCHSIATNQSLVLLMEKLTGELMIKCDRYTHGQSPDTQLFALCEKKRLDRGEKCH